MELNMQTIEEIKKKSIEIIQQSPDEVDDLWFGFSDEIDVNISDNNEEGKIEIFAYPVIDGQIDISVWKEIPFDYTLEQVLNLKA